MISKSLEAVVRNRLIFAAGWCRRSSRKRISKKKNKSITTTVKRGSKLVFRPHTTIIRTENCNQSVLDFEHAHQSAERAVKWRWAAAQVGREKAECRTDYGDGPGFRVVEYDPGGGGSGEPDRSVGCPSPCSGVADTSSTRKLWHYNMLTSRRHESLRYSLSVAPV